MALRAAFGRALQCSGVRGLPPGTSKHPAGVSPPAAGTQRPTFARQECQIPIASGVRAASTNGFVATDAGASDVLKSYGSMDAEDFTPRGGRVTSVAIIGAGSVGAATANAIIKERCASEVIMVDLDADRCLGEVLDLSDSAYLAGCIVRTGDLKAAGQADMVIVTAGAKQRPGESRTQLIDRNVGIMSGIMDGMKPFGKDTIVMTVANPVDILTSIAQRASGLPTSRVLGSGTFLDSMRLRGEVGRILGVASSSVHLYVVGEHGDSQVAAWSSGIVGGVPLDHFPEITPKLRGDLSAYTKNKAYEIINRKGATYFGVAACAASITRAVLLNGCTVLPLSCWSEKYGMYISQPCVVGSDGVQKVLDIHLNDDERQRLEASVSSMRSVLEKVDF